MTVFSLLRLAQPALKNIRGVTSLNSPKGHALQPFRLLSTGRTAFGGGHDRTMSIIPSKFQWQKYKDQLHFYVMLGLIPGLAIVFYTNVFIGPATLSEIPSDYRPQHWEYYRHPISRFFARYLLTMPQESYERNLHYIKEMDEARRLRGICDKVEKLMKERGDYPNIYASKINVGKYLRTRVLNNESDDSYRGDN